MTTRAINALNVQRTYTLTKRIRVLKPVLNAAGEVTGARYHYEGTPAEYNVIADFDVDSIIQDLADKAVRTKRGRSTAMRGKIKVKVIKQ